VKALDALVIGAGPAGSTCAALLARAGWSVGLAEKSRFPRDKVCGGFIGAPAFEVLKEIDAYDRLLQIAGPEIREVGFFAGRARIARPSPAFGRAVRRAPFDALLLDCAAAAGATVFQPAAIRSVERVHDRFVCVAEGDLELQARTVIAAHGSWQTGSLPTQLPKAHSDRDLLAFKAHFRGAELPPACMPLIAFPGGYGGLVQADDGLVTLSFCVRRDALQRCRARFPGVAAADAVFCAILHHCAGVREVLVNARRHGDWIATGPIRPGMRPFVSHGVHVIGNAAAEAHPAIAEGIGMAMQGAAILTDALLEGQPSYESAWRARFSRRMQFSRLVAGVAMSPPASTLAARVVEALPSVLPAFARFSGKSAMSGR